MYKFSKNLLKKYNKLDIQYDFINNKLNDEMNTLRKLNDNKTNDFFILNQIEKNIDLMMELVKITNKKINVIC